MIGWIANIYFVLGFYCLELERKIGFLYQMIGSILLTIIGITNSIYSLVFIGCFLFFYNLYNSIKEYRCVDYISWKEIKQTIYAIIFDRCPKCNDKLRNFKEEVLKDIKYCKSCGYVR